MSKIEQAIATLHEIEREAGSRVGRSRIHPAARLLVTLLFIIITVSFSKYDLLGLTGMVLYVLVIAITEEISVWKGLARVKYVLLLVLLMGAANPFLDRNPMIMIGSLMVTGGVISMATLVLKGVFTVFGAYLLVMTTGMEQICLALQTLGVPKGGVTVARLIYRYIIVLLKEVQRMTQAYQLRAPGQKGIHIRAWGSFVGLLLLRSMDRAQTVYDSMVLRGYDGSSCCEGSKSERYGVGVSICYVLGWMVVLLILRFVPVFQIIGNVFV